MSTEASFIPVSEWQDLIKYEDENINLLVETSTPANNYADQIKIYTSWNQWIVAGAGLVRTMAAILEKNLQPGQALTAINAASHTLYNAFQAMNDGILQGITDMQAGNAPEVSFDPTDLPDWPDDSKPDLFSSAWDVIKPLLIKVDNRLAAKYPSSPIIIALGGLINAGDKLIATLKHYYPQWGG